MFSKTEKWKISSIHGIHVHELISIIHFPRHSQGRHFIKFYSLFFHKDLFNTSPIHPLPHPPSPYTCIIHSFSLTPSSFYYIYLRSYTYKILICFATCLMLMLRVIYFEIFPSNQNYQDALWSYIQNCKNAKINGDSS